MRKIVLWILGIIVFIILTSFLLYPSLFLKEKSLWGKYENFEEVSNFNSTSYDLYRKVSDVTIILVNSEPIVSFNEEGITYLVFEVSEKRNDNKWPHKYIYDMVENAKSTFKLYCISALQDDEVISKRCIEVPFEKEEMVELFSSNGLTHEKGRSKASLEVLHMDDLYNYLKRKYTNDRDLIISFNITFDEF